MSGDVILALLVLIAGLALLMSGGTWLVRGSTAVALLAHLSKPVVGLTVVAMGTSMPELAVSVGAAANGSTEMSYGNIVGSNIFNIGIVLALAALVKPMPVGPQTPRIHYPFMMAATVVTILMGMNGTFGRVEGAVMFAALVGFTTMMIHQSRQGQLPVSTAEVDEGLGSRDPSQLRWGPSLVLVVVGITVLAVGAQLSVYGGVRLAEIFGVSRRVIGLTVLAMGTSLPELATAIAAARKDEYELVVGNVVGSNIFNLLGILALTGVTFPVVVNEAAASFDNWIMLGFSVALLPILWRKEVGRVPGAILLSGFAAYMWFLLAS